MQIMNELFKSNTLYEKVCSEASEDWEYKRY